MGKKQWNSIYIRLLQVKETSIPVLLGHKSAQTYFLPITVWKESVLTWALKTKEPRSLPLNRPVFPLLCPSPSLRVHQKMKGLSLPLTPKHSLQDTLAAYETRRPRRAADRLASRGERCSSRHWTRPGAADGDGMRRQGAYEPLGDSGGNSAPPPPPRAFLGSKPRCSDLRFFSFSFFFFLFFILFFFPLFLLKKEELSHLWIVHLF